MAKSSRIGALRVDLGLNSASFEKGLTKSQRKLQRFSRRLSVVGKNVAKVGKKLSVGITAPVTAAATAFGFAAHKMAGDAREIAKSAQVAGESFENFQRQAHAARTVGIEFEKLGDIFKDVRDRVGDFVATGGGPMKDFFENIAPKVGITAEAFKGLSGKDALQLYFDSLRKANVSQEEMVFYLEAMASDATNLIPLLEQNGKALKEIGDNANVISEDERKNLERYTKSQEKLEQATNKLVMALLGSGILDAVTSLVSGFAEFTARMAETSPVILSVGVAIAGLLAVVGPLLVAIGTLVTLAPAIATGLGVIKVAALGLMANPVILAFAGVIAGITAAWLYWDDIVPVLERLGGVVSSWYSENIKPTFDAVMQTLQPFIDYFSGVFAAQFEGVINLFSQLINGDFAGAWESFKTIGIRALQAFSNFHVKMGQIGIDLIKGLVRGIKDNAVAVWSAIKDIVLGAINSAKELLGIKSPSRVFMGIGLNLAEGFAIGISQGENEVVGAIELMAGKAEAQTVRIADSFKDMAENTLGSLQGLTDSIKNGGFFDILGGVLDLFLQLGSTGLFGSKLQANINSAPSFSGGGFTGTAPRTGGLDGQGGFLAMLHPRETVVDHHKGQGFGGGQTVVINNSAFADVFVDGKIQTAAPAIAMGGAKVAQSQMSRKQSRMVR